MRVSNLEEFGYITDYISEDKLIFIGIEPAKL